MGRFTSPDEFTGGPTELFVAVAAHNPTFYADPAEPQSLNKYHYSLNNPFRFVDVDGHQTTMADKIKLPTDGIATKILQGINQVRTTTNNILYGPEVSKAIDQGFNVLDQAQKEVNQILYGPEVGNTINAIQSNPTVQVAGLVVAAYDVFADVAAVRAVNSAAAVATDVAGAAGRGTGGAFLTRDGTMVSNTSGSYLHHPRVQGFLDSIPPGERTMGFHGKCCEPRLITDALNAGSNPTGGTMRVNNARRGRLNYGTQKDPCPSCTQLLRHFKIPF